MTTKLDGNIGRALAFATTPTIAFVLHDFVFQLPDNEGELTVGLVATLAALLFVWAASGWTVARMARGTITAILAGAIMAALSVAMVWLAFVVLNGLFVERMSYEPDRLLAFRRSGYPSLQEWWNHQRGWGPFPLLLVASAVVGALGGVIQRLNLGRLFAASSLQ
jgi:hypothetical protein